jgi:hypothetical protein
VVFIVTIVYLTINPVANSVQPVIPINKSIYVLIPQVMACCIASCLLLSHSSQLVGQKFFVFGRSRVQILTCESLNLAEKSVPPVKLHNLHSRIKPRSIPSTSLSIHYLLIVMQFKAL